MSLASINLQDYLASPDTSSYVNGVILPAFVDEMLARFESGALKVPEWNQLYQMSFFSFVEEYLRYDEYNQNRPIIKDIFKGKFFGYFYHQCREAKAAAESGDMQAAEAIFEKIRSGNMEPSDVFECALKKDRLRVEFNQWNMGISQRGNPFEPDLSPSPDIYSMKIDFPTGKLIMTDWIRIDEFTDVAEDAQSLHSINNIEGQLIRTADMLGMNMIHVFSGNCGPSVFKVDDMLSLGYGKPIDGVKTIGGIDTSLWWATVIDRQDVLDIIREEDPDFDETKLDEEIEDCVKIDVEPGEYHVYFNAMHEDMTDSEYKKVAIEPDGHEALKSIKSMILISREPLTFEGKLVVEIEPNKPEPIPGM